MCILFIVLMLKIYGYLNLDAMTFMPREMLVNFLIITPYLTYYFPLRKENALKKMNHCFLHRGNLY